MNLSIYYFSFFTDVTTGVKSDPEQIVPDDSDEKVVETTKASDKDTQKPADPEDAPAPVVTEKGEKKKAQPSTKKDEERPPPAADKGEKDEDKHPVEPPSVTGAGREESASPQEKGTSKKVTKDVPQKSAGEKSNPYHGKLSIVHLS